MLRYKSLNRACTRISSDRQGEVEAYCLYTVSEGLRELEELIERGATFEQARELVFDDMMPKSPETIAEVWEIEGAAEN